VAVLLSIKATCLQGMNQDQKVFTLIIVVRTPQLQGRKIKSFQESLQATEQVWLLWRVQFYQEIGVYGARMEVTVPIQRMKVSRVHHLGSTALGLSVEELLKNT
jgi:hypothetical protein